MLAMKISQEEYHGDGFRILDALNVAIIILDGAQRVTYVNAFAENLLGASIGSLTGRSFSELLSGVEPSSLLDRLGEAPKALTERETVITLANGRAIFADYSIYPLDDADDGELLVEIRPQERRALFAQEGLHKLYKQASHQLSRSLAHEINNPLGGIRGAAQLLQRELENPDQIEFIEVI